MNMRKRLVEKFVCGVVMLALMVGVVPKDALAATVPIYHDIPAYQQRDVFETETTDISGITVTEVVNGETKPIEKPIQFKIFNTVKQELEDTVQSTNGVLPTLKLIKNHNYMIYAVDSEYTMTPPAFGWVKEGKLLNIKENVNKPYNYPEITNLQLEKRKAAVSDPEEDRRCTVKLGVFYADGPMSNINIKFISDVETVEETAQKGSVTVSLLEEVTYMVTVDNSNYSVDSFPIAIKDKSEYGGVRYSYDHSNCKKVEKIQLVDKKNAHKNDTTVTSLSGDTTVTGFNFKDFLIIDRKTDKDLGAGWENKEYDVIDIKVVNPHRWEISKLAAGDFKITENVADNKMVEHVYYIDKEEQLQEIDFEQSGNQVNFTMNSLSLYPIVLEYNPVKAPLRIVLEEAAGYDETDFTPESWAPYSEAIEKAKELINNDNATADESQKAAEAVNEAKEKLVLATVSPEVKAKLESLIATAGKRKAATYTATSWKAYSEAITKAKALIANENATNRDCKAVIQAINNTEKKLVLAPIKVSKIAVSGTSKQIAAGKSIQLTAQVAPANAANKAVTWTTSNKNYATVSSKGKVTTKKAGAGKTVKITATAKDGSGKKSVYQIKIMKHAVKSITLKAKKTVTAGKSVTVKATVKTTGKNANKKLTWSTSNKNYATVNSKGKVVTKKAGKGKTVTITAKATDGSGKKKTVKIKMK